MDASRFLLAHPELISAEVVDVLSWEKISSLKGLVKAANRLGLPAGDRHNRRQLCMLLVSIRETILRFLELTNKGVRPGIRVRVYNGVVTTVLSIDITGRVRLKGVPGSFHPRSIHTLQD